MRDTWIINYRTFISIKIGKPSFQKGQTVIARSWIPYLNSTPGKFRNTMMNADRRYELAKAYREGKITKEQYNNI